MDEEKFGIYFHGGGYFAGSYTSHKNLVSKLTSNSKMVIYFFEYRLSPEFNFPSANEDAQVVVEYLHNLENKKTSIWMGESAGGGLATGLIVDKKFKISPDKLVLISPWLDLSNKSEDRKFLKNKDITIILNGMHDVGEFYAGEYGSNNPIISPVYADIDNFPETLIQVSSSELLFNDALEFVKKLNDKNCDWIIANDVSDKTIGFDSDLNEVSIFYKNSKEETIKKMSKKLIADEIVNRIITNLN